MRVRRPRPKRPMTPSLAMISLAAATGGQDGGSVDVKTRSRGRQEGRTVADVALVRLAVRL